MPDRMLRRDGAFLRRDESQVVWRYLNAQECCSVVGISNIGKSALLRMICLPESQQGMDGPGRDAIFVYVDICLSNHLLLLIFNSHINTALLSHIYNSVIHLSLRSFDKTKIVDFGIYAKRRNQTNIRPFRGFNRAEATIMSIVHVSNFKSCTIS